MAKNEGPSTGANVPVGAGASTVLADAAAPSCCTTGERTPARVTASYDLPSAVVNASICVTTAPSTCCASRSAYPYAAGSKEREANVAPSGGSVPAIIVES
jgi:hypothetical protein